MTGTDQFESVLKQLRSLNAAGEAGTDSGPTLVELCDAALGPADGSGKLNQVMFEGDQIAVAVVDAIAGIEAVIPEIARRILAITRPRPTGSEIPAIQFVFAPGTVDPQTIRALNQIDGQIRCSIHNSDDEQQSALLAIGCEANPLAINRDLFDADVVLVLASPAGTALETERPDLFPAFGSVAGRMHFEKQKPKKQVADRDSVARSLGVEFRIAITTGPGGVPDAVFAGVHSEVSDAIARQVRQAWTLPSVSRMELIVVTLESPPGQNSWDGFFDALRTASQHVGEHAPLVVISQIDNLPPPNVARAISQALDGDDHSSSQVPQDLLVALRQRPVYLASGLDRQAVEDLGLGYLESADELGRLVKRHSDCGLIRDAHKCISASGAGIAG